LAEQDDGSLMLIDYKTDRGHTRLADLIQRYRVQVGLYRQAVSSILRRPVSRVYLVFLALGRVVEVGAEIEADDLAELPPQVSSGS
jgi:ATP-dependent helicase/nuclease subunit A